MSEQQKLQNYVNSSTQTITDITAFNDRMSELLKDGLTPEEKEEIQGVKEIVIAQKDKIRIDSREKLSQYMVELNLKNKDLRQLVSQLMEKGLISRKFVVSGEIVMNKDGTYELDLPGMDKTTLKVSENGTYTFSSNIFQNGENIIFRNSSEAFVKIQQINQYILLGYDEKREENSNDYPDNIQRASEIKQKREKLLSQIMLREEVSFQPVVNNISSPPQAETGKITDNIGEGHNITVGNEVIKIENQDQKREENLLALVKKDISLQFMEGRIYVYHRCPNGKIQSMYFTIAKNPDIKDEASLQARKKQAIEKLEKKYSTQENIPVSSETGRTTSSPSEISSEAAALETSLTYEQRLKKVNDSFDAWKLAIKSAEGTLNEQEIQTHFGTIDAAYKEIAETIIDFQNNHITGKDQNDPNVIKDKEMIKSIYNEIALYNRGGTGTRNFRNPLLAEQLLLSSLGQSEPPKKPDLGQVLESLDNPTKTLFRALIDKEVKNGLAFEEAFGKVLGNPTIKGAWNKVSDKLGENYDDVMKKYLNDIDVSSLTLQEKKAYDQLIDMKGLGGFLDFKDENKMKMILGRDQLLALGAGIAGGLATVTGVGAAGGVPLLAYSAAILAGGAITTGANMVLNQKMLSGKDFAFETAINSGTFVVGGLIFKLARSGVIASRGAKAVYGAEAMGDVTMGISIDQIRASYQGIDISLAESLKDNLAWALLPFVTGGIANRINLATKTKKVLEEIEIRKKLGDEKGAGETLKKLDEEISEIRKTGEKNQGISGFADSGTSDVGNILSKKGNITQSELTLLDNRRILLNTEASQPGITPQRLEAINKEVRLIDSKIRNSQLGENGAKSSAETYLREVEYDTSPRTTRTRGEQAELKDRIRQRQGGQESVGFKDHVEKEALLKRDNFTQKGENKGKTTQEISLTSRDTILRVEKEIGEINMQIAKLEQQIKINEANAKSGNHNPKLLDSINEQIRIDIEKLKGKIEIIKKDNGIIEVEYDISPRTTRTRGEQAELKDRIRQRQGGQESVGFSTYIEKEALLKGHHFTQAFENGLPKTYNIVKFNGEYMVYLKQADGNYIIATVENGGIPKGSGRANFDARIENEIKNFNTKGKSQS